jgi:hypothetical protein
MPAASNGAAVATCELAVTVERHPLGEVGIAFIWHLYVTANTTGGDELPASAVSMVMQLMQTE